MAWYNCYTCRLGIFELRQRIYNVKLSYNYLMTHDNELISLFSYTWYRYTFDKESQLWTNITVLLWKGTAPMIRNTVLQDYSWKDLKFCFWTDGLNIEWYFASIDNIIQISWWSQLAPDTLFYTGKYIKELYISFHDLTFWLYFYMASSSLGQ